MKRTILIAVICSLVLLVINFSCSKNDSPGNGNTNPPTGAGIDSALVNIGNNIIIPGYQLFSAGVNSLDSSILDFNQNPTATKLQNTQGLFKKAYLAYESVSEFAFGPDDTEILASLNLFPANAVRIDSNIHVNSANLDAFINKSAKGFPALDYLLYSTDNTALLTQYTTGSEAGSRKQYLAAVSAEIKDAAGTILNAWLPSGGNYINTFIAATGTSVGSSLGELINSVNKDYEIIKNNRLGIPLGKQTAEVLQPKEVEAYYSGISLQLALAQLKAVQSIYLGTGANGNGKGLNTYLVKINAQYNGGSLDNAIKNQFTAAISKLHVLADPLSATIVTNTTAVNAAYVEIQKLLVLLKTDMPSSLGVLITYADNDGD